MVRGLAGAQKLADSGLAPAGCRHCGAAEYSDFNLLWVCPRFEECRPPQLIQKIKDPMLLPLALRDFGLAPELASNTAGPYWAGYQLDLGGEQRPLVPGIGISWNTADTATRLPGDSPTVNAREIVERQRADIDQEQLAPPRRVNGCVPAIPNAFTDASLAPTGCMDLALAQLAVWIPGKRGAP
jgi:hypothetical protein